MIQRSGKSHMMLAFGTLYTSLNIASGFFSWGGHSIESHSWISEPVLCKLLTTFPQCSTVRPDTSVLWFTPAASRTIVSLYTTKLSGQALKLSIKYGKTYDDDDIHTHTMVTMIVWRRLCIAKIVLDVPCVHYIQWSCWLVQLPKLKPALFHL